MRHPIIDEGPDPVGTMLGTLYRRFRTESGLSGLYRHREGGQGINILAVFNENPGNGAFREFVKDLKGWYYVICVWQISNPMLDQALARYGFTDDVEIENGETIKGKRWDRP